MLPKIKKTEFVLRALRAAAGGGGGKGKFFTPWLEDLLKQLLLPFFNCLLLT